MRFTRSALAALVAVSLAGSPLVAQETGTITGQVIDAATQRPLPSAQVFLVGTQRGSLTNQDGRFVVPGVRPGTHEVRVSLIGYGQGTQTVEVTAGASATANFQLAPSAVELGAVIVTASGREERVRAMGNAVGNISPADVEMAAVQNMADLLQGRSAGVSVVQSGGTSGTGARVRVRGSASVSLSNEPLIIIDGVRVDNTAESATIGIGGQSPSRLNDINPESIERIEVLKGPAAAALYGTAAANGVIQITTRRGQAGAARWSAYAEQGHVTEPTRYPGNYVGLGTNAAGAAVRCTVYNQAMGSCTPTELISANPLMDAATTPFIDGSRGKYGVNVSGGSDQATYFVGADYETEQGVYAINQLDRVNLRANLQSQLRDDLRLSVRTGYLQSNLSLPQNDNNLLGILLGGMIGDPRSEATNYYYAWTPDELQEIHNRQEMDRFTGSINANWQPFHWLSIVGTTGIDRYNRFDSQQVQPGIINLASTWEGYRQANNVSVQNLTNTVDATATYPVRPSIFGTTSAGLQLHSESYHDTRAYGRGLTAGTGSLRGTTRLFSVSENATENVTLGAYVQQQLAFNDRLYLTGALRGDQNSAFGTDIGFVVYPSLSASWVISEEDFFPQIAGLSNLRLRSALGQSGLKPRFRDALRFYSPVPVTVAGQDVPGITLGTTTGAEGSGNPSLRPEISTEFEFGVDAGLLQDRVGVELTYYDKRSQDALVFRRLAPSLGATTGRFENIGSVRNTGVEAAINTTLLETDRVRWGVNFSASRNRNELTELGEGVEPIIFGLGGDTQRHTEGFPLGGYWQRTFTYDDANGDGLLQQGEVTMSTESEYLGTPFPTLELSLSNDIRLFDRVTVSGLLDYKGGHKLLNYTRYDRCVFERLCGEVNDVSQATLESQAAYIASAVHGSQAGYVEDASFVKLRELAVSFAAPEAWTQRANLSNLRFTLAGRNLGTWTNYTGLDPEVNFAGQANFSTADFYTQPPVRYFTARVDVNF